ncbi:Hypothetical predicted protein [Octopus vulgaris]|uniref:Uncharacterized protein n=1 Tax=Octopus vulgaris TaxID=6645 RepID=A0AA36FGP3_OCTVU|nr:Hypothetical predicted protein [Octopus vulgaris]
MHWQHTLQFWNILLLIKLKLVLFLKSGEHSLVSENTLTIGWLSPDLSQKQLATNPIILVTKALKPPVRVVDFNIAGWDVTEGAETYNSRQHFPSR